MMPTKPLYRLHRIVASLLMLVFLYGCASVSSVAKDVTNSIDRSSTSGAKHGQLYQLIAKRNYVDAIEKLNTLYENFPNSPRDETRFRYQVENAAFNLPTDHERKLNNFIQRYKNQPAVQYFEGMVFQYKGLKARGEKSAKETPKEDLRVMQKALARSSDLFNLVLYKDPSNFLAHSKLALNLSYISSNDLSNEHFELALDYSPTNFDIWQSYLNHNKPRWGGSHEKMQDIIYQLENYESENPRLTRLKGLMLADKSDIARRNEQYDEAERFIFAALEFQPHKQYGRTVDYLYHAVKRSGDIEAACRISKKVNAIYPKNKRYQQYVEECR